MLYPRENSARGLMNLGGLWRFMLDEKGTGFTDGWQNGLPEGAQTLAVPASYNEQRELKQFRDHCGWAFYEKELVIPAFFAGQRLVLRFDAVTHWAKVYLNGNPLTEHKGGFLPFEADITSLVQPGETIRITVAVNNEINHGTLPIGNEGAAAFFGSDNPGIPSVEAAKAHRGKQNMPNFDFFNYAGINRPVRIYTTPAVYIDDITIIPHVQREDIVYEAVSTNEEANACRQVQVYETVSEERVWAKEAQVDLSVVIAGGDEKAEGADQETRTDIHPQTLPQVRILDEKGLCVAEAVMQPESELDGQGKLVMQFGEAEADQSAAASQPETDRETVSVLQLKGTRYRAVIQLSDVNLWEPHPGKPYLYTAEISCGGDVYEQPFGIRTVEVSGTQFLINGRPFYFKGCCKHEDAPVRGRGFDLTYQVKDISMLKWLHANSFRTSHYPYAEEVYDLCDREGIVVIDETPAVGIGAGEQTDPYQSFHMHAHHEQVIREYIARDKNHPCVVLWSLGNEPDLEHFPESAYSYWHHLYELAHALDPQDRPVTVVCCQNDYTKDITTRTMDVVCINRYYGWYNVSGDMDAACYGWNMELDFWEKIGKPVMCSEYGADTVEGIHQTVPEMFSEEYQIEFYERTNAEFDKRSFFIGEHVWNFADFRAFQGPMRVDGNRKGILTRDRRPKMAAHWLRERWAKIPNFGYKG